MQLNEICADQLVIWGFMAAYLGIMGAMLVLTIPALEGLRAPLILYGLLPVAGLGVAANVAGNLFHPRTTP